ncbi:hypothetical protein L1887_03559 [Cichorium endivia]|nr:hypothetical protein L1887_03559 [Cichorium endivia]
MGVILKVTRSSYKYGGYHVYCAIHPCELLPYINKIKAISLSSILCNQEETHCISLNLSFLDSGVTKSGCFFSHFLPIKEG